MARPAFFDSGVAVITGAAAGIGSGLAHAAARAGMTVIAADVAQASLEATVASIREDGGTAHGHVVDVADESQMAALAAKIEARFGSVGLLVNNAAIEALGPIWQAPASVWRRVLEINLIGVANGLSAFVPGMIERGAPACVANVASIAALGSFPGNGVYVASKAAVLAVTETLRVELEVLGKPIHVVAVLPGGVATRILEEAYVNPCSGELAGFIDGARQRIHTMMDPMEAGRLVFEGLCGDGFWVSTHPEQMAGLARARGAQLAELRPPVEFSRVSRT
jgi:NAD(P)-dependent dehydrogenase (short-subunit alcohol dehydrogenase family)